MVNIAIIGGGWSGSAAAITARKAGAEVHLFERTDMLLGAGLVGGIFRNNGRFTALEENVAMGGGDLFDAMDNCARFKGITFPGHEHASIYDVHLMEPAVRDVLENYGISVHDNTRIVDVIMQDNKIKGIVDEERNNYFFDVFIDATGTFGPVGNCVRYGNGCAMCVQRCPSFGPRVSIARRAGVQELAAEREDGSLGSMSGSGKLAMDSLSDDLQLELSEKGSAIIPLPKEMIDLSKLAMKPCQQYALPAFAENIVLLNTGHAKIMSPFFPLEKLRRIKGLERARFADPYAGGRGNSIRFMAISPHDDSLQVEGIENLFCCGEKAGFLVGHTEAISTGNFAGHNAVRHILGVQPLVVPRTTAIGEFIAYSNRMMMTSRGLKEKYTFSGSVFFERMVKQGLYTTDAKQISLRIAQVGLTDVYKKSF